MMYTVDNIRRYYLLLKRAGIRRRNPYHTRHAFACWLAAAGADGIYRQPNGT